MYSYHLHSCSNINSVFFYVVFLQTDHIDNYKAKNQNTVKTNFCNASKPQKFKI